MYNSNIYVIVSTIILFDTFVNIKRIELDYSINRNPIPDQVKSIAKEWNNDDFTFYMNLQVRTISLSFQMMSTSHLNF